MRSPSAKYLYGLTSTFGTSVNVTQAEIDAVDAEARAEAHALKPVPVNPDVDELQRDTDDRDEHGGETCSSRCGYCGRCS